MRKAIFPQDWIAPREFHFCHCGNYLTLKNATSDKHVETCGFCKYKHAFTKIRNLDIGPICVRPNLDSGLSVEFVETIPHEAVEERKKTLELHEKLSKERMALAEKRRSEGIRPVFWVEIYNVEYAMEPKKERKVSFTESFNAMMEAEVEKAKLDLARKTDNMVIEAYRKFGLEPPEFKPDEDDG